MAHTLKAKARISFQCECGSYLYVNPDDTATCMNPECAHHGKSYHLPTIELQPVHQPIAEFVET